jgi:hypothetical protein
VGDGVTLTLRNITFKGLSGGGNEGKNTIALFYVDGGTLILEADAAIRDNYNESTEVQGGHRWGGGVLIGRWGTLVMRGGTISGNYTGTYGGGVTVVKDGTLTMETGEIAGNTAEARGGGVCVERGARFTMNGGTIKDNKVQEGSGGGVYVLGASFEMKGGVINGNQATGKDSLGGGVFINATDSIVTFHKTGGTIQLNTAVYGKAVFAQGEWYFNLDNPDQNKNRKRDNKAGPDLYLYYQKNDQDLSTNYGGRGDNWEDWSPPK